MTALQYEAPIGHPVWLVVLISFGISLTAAWIGLLGYGLYQLIDLAV